MSKTQISKKHFVFDLDDTLIDGRQFCGESMARAITKFEPGVSFDEVVELHDKLRGLTVMDLYKNAIKELRLKTDIDILIAEDSKIQTKEFEELKIFPGVVEIFEFLQKSGKELHICTNRKSESLIPILKINDIEKYFSTVISCADRGKKKPNPFCLKELIKDLGGSMEEFIYFGDSEVDSEFAKNAGIDFIIFDQYLNNKVVFKRLINIFLDDKINGI